MPAGENLGQQFQFPDVHTRPAHPWEQSYDQFANHPDTMWHARKDPEWPEPATGHPILERQGFHVGTYASSLDRLHDAAYRDPAGERLGTTFPARLTGKMYNTPEAPIKDQDDRWTREHHGHFYRNDLEDPGSISAVVPSPSPRHVMNYEQFAVKAIKEGRKNIHPQANAVARQKNPSPGEPCYKRYGPPRLFRTMDLRSRTGGVFLKNVESL